MLTLCWSSSSSPSPSSSSSSSSSSSTSISIIPWYLLHVLALSQSHEYWVIFIYIKYMIITILSISTFISYIYISISIVSRYIPIYLYLYKFIYPIYLYHLLSISIGDHSHIWSHRSQPHRQLQPQQMPHRQRGAQCGRANGGRGQVQATGAMEKRRKIRMTWENQGILLENPWKTMENSEKHGNMRFYGYSGMDEI